MQRAYDLALWLIQKVEKFPRSHRFGVGERIVARALDLVERLTAAAYSADKRAPLEAANEAVNSLRLLLRLAFDLRLLTWPRNARRLSWEMRLSGASLPRSVAAPAVSGTR